MTDTKPPLHAGHAGLQALAERYWQLLRHEFPLNALLAGQPNDEPTMFREGPADAARRAAAAGRLLDGLQHIDPAQLAQADRVTWHLLQRELHDLQQVHQTLSHLKPWLLPGGPEFNAIYFANNSVLASAADARRYVDRLATLGRLFDDVRACMDEAHARGVRLPRVVLQAVCANVRRLADSEPAQSPWLGPFRTPRPGDTQHTTQAARALAQVTDVLNPALQRWLQQMEQRLLPAARESLSCLQDPEGPDYYDFWCRHFTTLPDVSPDDLHRLGLDEVARLEDEIAGLASAAGFDGDAERWRAHLRDEPSFYASDAAQLRQQVESLAKRIDGCIPTLIPRLPRASYGVRSIPAGLSEALPLAYAQPGPADGSAAGTFWISGLPHKVPRFVQLPVALHEAWPGHLMHIALMQEMVQLPMFRRANFTKYTACLEGWAMYCESLGVDMGLYETPEQHYGRLDLEMWRACRLVVDTGIHLHGWSRAQACAYMARRLSLPAAAVEAEVDRYIAMPGQALAYLPGGLKLRELRQRASQRLGEHFDLRAFHGQVLAAGAVTLQLLDRLIDDWIAAQPKPREAVA